MTTAAAIVLVALGWAAGRSRAPVAAIAHRAPAPSATAPADGKTLSDGTRVVALSDATRFDETRRDATTTFVSLNEGAARFEIASSRSVHVDVGAVSAEGEGVLEVTRTSEGAIVTLRSGHALVAWALGEATLAPGETRVLPPPIAAPAPPPSGAPKTEKTWRALARSGNYDAAYADLRAAGPSNVRDIPEELLLAADVARLSGHPRDAVAPLERVVRDHASDARAPLAAFTLGRVELDQLGMPRDAAAAFAKARALDPKGALAEDALAREVEAWARAGETNLARERASAYVAEYPTGRALRSVRAFGELP